MVAVVIAGALQRATWIGQGVVHRRELYPWRVIWLCGTVVRKEIVIWVALLANEYRQVDTHGKMRQILMMRKKNSTRRQ